MTKHRLADNPQLAAITARRVADDQMTPTYAVLVDTGCDWPDIVFVGSWQAASDFRRDLHDLDDSINASVQAIVSLNEALSFEPDE